mmetsp:Transcript_64155/g.140599  ORF Transcript_64155/g.140599 Transcript_64155/m.140599 type:complete len:214 (+) Transcript_64155:588-1229(+)
MGLCSMRESLFAGPSPLERNQKVTNGKKRKDHCQTPKLTGFAVTVTPVTCGQNGKLGGRKNSAGLRRWRKTGRRMTQVTQGLPGLSKKSSGIDECMRREERRTHTMPVTAHTAKLAKMETDQVAKQASQGKQTVPNRSQNQLNLHLPQTNQSTQYRPTRPRSLIHLLTSQLLGALSRRGYQTGYLAQELFGLRYSLAQRYRISLWNNLLRHSG